MPLVTRAYARAITPSDSLPGCGVELSSNLSHEVAWGFDPCAGYAAGKTDDDDHIALRSSDKYRMVCPRGYSRFAPDISLKRKTCLQMRT